MAICHICRGTKIVLDNQRGNKKVVPCVVCKGTGEVTEAEIKRDQAVRKVGIRYKAIHNRSY